MLVITQPVSQVNKITQLNENKSKCSLNWFAGLCCFMLVLANLVLNGLDGVPA